MLAELTRIQGGGSAPSGGYLLQLCPGETFPVSDSGAMQIVLDDVTIRCGGADTTDPCILDGNDEQVVVLDTTEEVYTITNVTLSGITFNGLESDGVAISLDLSSTAEFRCIDCSFQDFDSVEYLVQASQATNIVMENILIQSTEPENPATVNEALIDSPGGTVTLRDIVVTDVSASEDFFRISGGGAMIITDADLSGNIVQGSIVRAEEGAALQFNESNISENDFEGEVVYAAGVSTSVILSDVTMDNNAGNEAWTGIFIGGGASAEILDSSFTSNEGLQYMITAQQMDTGGASVSIQRSEFTNNEADTVADPTSLVSAIGFNSGTPDISMLRIDFKRNSGFTSNFMTLTGGSFVVRQACFDNNFNLFVGFLGTGGQEFAADNNYVSRRETSQGCTGSQQRLAIESADSGNCFTESETACFVDCSPGLEDADECLFDIEIEPSAQPSSSSSGEASESPSMEPSSSNAPTQLEQPVPTQSNRPSAPTGIPSAQPPSEPPQPTTSIPTEFEISVSPSLFPSVWFAPITSHPTIYIKPTPTPTSGDSVKGKGKGKDGALSKAKGKGRSKSSKGSSKASKASSKGSKGSKSSKKSSTSSSSSSDDAEKPTSRPTPGPTSGRVVVDRGSITSSVNYWNAVGGASGVYRLYNFADSTAETSTLSESSGEGVLFIGD
eukprot:Nitzschia sp. Nitz4//scaffold10_size219509//67176//69581//NITZ4_001414-RA/size219509-augustus-gene-0.269-mRNA-1//-1//CDS//3329532878//561//frame0